jgi:hypothetical protein
MQPRLASDLGGKRFPAPTLGWLQRADPDGLHYTANRGAELTDSHTADEEPVDPRWAIVPAAGETAGHAWSIAQTLGGELERVRLAHRTRRIDRVLVSLRERRTERARAGAVPTALNRAIEDFTCELAQLRVRLSAMPSPPQGPASEPSVMGAGSTTMVPGEATA